tara:strand:+ start:938 stop:2674 length:1737 start_codon:yes stop_codon:yes gene_type:complete
MTESRKTDYSLIFDLFKIADRRRRIQFIILAFLLILASFAEVFTLGAVVPFIAAISNPESVLDVEYLEPFFSFFRIETPQDVVIPMTILFCSTALMAALLQLIRLWFSTRLSFAFGADISLKVYRQTLYQPYEFHSLLNSSEIINGISYKSTTVIYGIVYPTFILISSCVMVASIFSFLIYLDPFIALTTFTIFGAIYALIVVMSKRILNKNSEKIALESTQVIKAVQEGLGGIREVLLDSNQEIFCKVYRSSDRPFRKAQGDNVVIGQSPRFLMEGLGITLIAAVASSAAINSESFSNVIPTLAGLALGAQRVLPALQQGYNAWSNINGSMESLKDSLDLINKPTPISYEANVNQPMDFQDRIELSNIHFSYSNNENKIFNGLNLSIKKGETVGIKGVTGSGKSTLIDILVGLLEPQDGHLSIDGVPINQLNLQAWQKNISYVPQSIFITDSTLKENIAFGVSEDFIDMDKVKIAAREAQLIDFIEDLPNKYDTRLGERGAFLSGGQLQRIGIARAIYKESSVVIFDEATSALDTDTESKVMRSINNLGSNLTILIIAHRLSTLEGCDKIIDLDEIK